MKRDLSISISRGIGIILMVFAHASVYNYPNSMIYLFHMPLFFLLSGYCFKDKSLQSFPSYLARKIKTLYLPYVLVAVSALFLHNYLMEIGVYGTKYPFQGAFDHMRTLPETIGMTKKAIIGMNATDNIVGGIWFLKQLFWGSLFLFAIAKAKRVPPLVWLLIIVAVFIAFDHFNYELPRLELRGMTFLSLLFIYLGYLYRRHGHEAGRTATIGMAIILFTVACFYSDSMFTATSFTLLPYTLLACIGSYLVFAFSRWLMSQNRLAPLASALAYAGDHSLAILILHFPAIKLVSLLIIKIYSLDEDMLSMHPTIADYSYRGWWLAYLLAGVTLPLAIQFTTRKAVTMLQRLAHSK